MRNIARLLPLLAICGCSGQQEPTYESVSSELAKDAKTIDAQIETAAGSENERAPGGSHKSAE